MDEIDNDDLVGVVCWCCDESMSMNVLRDNDGFCVNCDNEIDLEEPPYKVK